MSWNTLPKSTNAEMRAAGVSSRVGKYISSEPMVFSAPPIGCRKVLPSAVSRGPSVLSRKPRTERTPPA